MDNKLIWLSEHSTEHNMGIRVRCKDKEFVDMSLITIQQICQSRGFKQFVQFNGTHELHTIKEFFIEFVNDTNSDKILEIIEFINKRYGKKIYSGEVLLETPSRELLIELELL